MADLRELRAFVAVAERLSFTRAAQDLSLAQQTVSKTIRDLERDLQVELLERTTQSVRLTAAGAALVDPARDAIAQAELAFATATAVASGRTGTVRVGVTPAVGPDARAEVVRALRSAADLTVSLRQLRPGELGAELRDRRVDIALASVTGTDDTGLDRTALREGALRVHVPAGHRLAQASRVTLADFDGEPMVAASPPGTPYTDLLMERFAAAGATVVPVVAHVTGGAQLLGELLEIDAIAPQPAGTPSPEGVMALDVPGLTMPLTVLWLAGRRPPPAVALLRERLGTSP